MKYISGKPESVMDFPLTCQKFLKTREDVMILNENVILKSIQSFGRKLETKKRVINFSVQINGEYVNGFQYIGLGVLIKESAFVVSADFINEMLVATNGAVSDAPYEEDYF